MQEREDNRSAIWGGATGGLLIGFVVGFFRENYWQTVLYVVMIGAALGVGSEVFAHRRFDKSEKSGKKTMNRSEITARSVRLFDAITGEDTGVTASEAVDEKGHHTLHSRFDEPMELPNKHASDSDSYAKTQTETLPNLRTLPEPLSPVTAHRLGAESNKAGERADPRRLP